MTDVLRGEVVAVSVVEVGSSTPSGVAAGSLVLPVEDVSEFDEGGGTTRLMLGDAAEDDPPGLPEFVDVQYSGIQFAEGEEEPEGDPSIDALLLVVPLAYPVTSDVPVLVMDEATGVPVREVRAEVLLDGEADDETVSALVDHALVAYLSEGMRDEWQYESVELTERGDVFYVTNIVNRIPSFDGGVVAPETIGPIQIAPLAIEQVHIAPNAITADAIADLSIPVVKFRSSQHHLY